MNGEENAKRNTWIQHICPQSEDGYSDPPGIEVFFALGSFRVAVLSNSSS